MVDRLLTINIRKYLSTQPRTKRARKAARYIRERVSHYTKIKEENIRMSQELNALIYKVYWKHMTPVKLKVKIGTDTADVIPFKEGTAAAETKTEAKEAPKKKPFLGISKKEKEAPAKAPASPASQTQPKPAQAKPKPQPQAQDQQKPSSQ